MSHARSDRPQKKTAAHNAKKTGNKAPLKGRRWPNEKAINKVPRLAHVANHNTPTIRDRSDWVITKQFPYFSTDSEKIFEGFPQPTSPQKQATKTNIKGK